MQQKDILTIRDVIQSSNVNFLIGAGASTPYFPVLGSIEDEIDNSKDNEAEKINAYKRYLKDIMLPNKRIADTSYGYETRDQSINYQKTLNNYKAFYSNLTDLLIRRKHTLLSKQINVFTSNIDILSEKSLEEASIEYNDGFSGRLIPTEVRSNVVDWQEQRQSPYSNLSSFLHLCHL